MGRKLAFANDELAAFHRPDGERKSQDRGSILGAQLRSVRELFNHRLK
jgi:hypothetical protein